jgi:hypothetical protein
MNRSFTLNARTTREHAVPDSANEFDFVESESSDKSNESDPESEEKSVGESHRANEPEPEIEDAKITSKVVTESDRVRVSEPASDDTNVRTKVVADSPPEPDTAEDTEMIIAEQVNAFVTRNVCPAQARTVELMSTLIRERREFKKEMKKSIEDGKPLLTEETDRYKAAVKDYFDRLNMNLITQRDKLDGLIQYRGAIMMVDFKEEYEGKVDDKTTSQRPRPRTLLGKALLFWEWVIGLNIEDDVSECLFNPVTSWSIHDMEDVRTAITTGGTTTS